MGFEESMVHSFQKSGNSSPKIQFRCVKNIIMEAVSNNKTQCVPLIGIAGVSLSNTTIKENLTNSEIQFDTINRICNRFKPDCIFTFMDLTVEVESLGLKINFPENESPSVSGHSIKNRALLEEVKANYKGISGRMNVFIDTVKKMSENIAIKKGAYVIGPFSLAGELCGVNDLLMNLIEDPEFAHGLIEFSLKVIADYSNKLFEAGADTVCVLEPTAMMLSADLYDEFSLEPFKKLLNKVDNRPLILHICGDTTHLVDGMCKSGASALSLDSLIDFKKIIKQIPTNIDLIGNLDPVGIFLNGDVKSVSGATSNLMEEMKGHSNFVLSSGCDLPLETPLENVDAFMKVARYN